MGEVTTPVIVVKSHAVAVRVVSVAEEFENLAVEWDTLVGAMPRPSPFLLHPWLTEWWRHYHGRGRLCVVVARREGALVGALPLYVDRTSGLRVLRFLGGGHSALADALLAPTEDASTIERLTAAASTIPHDFGDFFGIPGDSRLRDALEPDRVRLIKRVEAPVLDLSTGWEHVYRSKTNAKKRNLHRRRRRQLEALGQVETSVARDEDALASALEEAFRLHRLRRTGRPDGSGFTTTVGMSFHRAALRALAPMDVPRIVTTRLDGRPIAFHYYFALAGSMYVHCLGFDPAYSRVSPGQVNTLDPIAVAANEGLHRVEFLGGAERYKMELADRADPLFEAVTGGRTLQGSIAAAARFGMISGKLALKRSPRIQRLYLTALSPVRRAAARMGAQ
jgi:CelD/BcsL family acetyltransferase involved in cellulose biosynthesis